MTHHPLRWATCQRGEISRDETIYQVYKVIMFVRRLLLQWDEQ